MARGITHEGFRPKAKSTFSRLSCFLVYSTIVYLIEIERVLFTSQEGKSSVVQKG